MGWALRCPPLPMWLFMTLPMRRGSALRSAAVEVVDQRAEDGGVGHLPADDARLDLGAAEVGAQLAHQQPLDLVDEAVPW